MPSPATRALTGRVTTLLIAVVLLMAGILLPAAPAQAASRGAGFGDWAPVSTYGWHGSMLVNGVHTYCILPGASAPTGRSTDRGTRTSVLGLSPKQLAGINLLVTKYGQTNDPVQAASVAWAVKAIADRDAALHHYGYRGSSLAGAVNWTFSALAPKHNLAVQKRAVAYYKEATRIAVPPPPKGRLVFTTDAADHRRGTVTAQLTSGSAKGTITLVGATFATGGSSTLRDARAGVSYAIRATTTPGRPHTVRGTGRFAAPMPAAIRHYTTPGAQDTAGPAAPMPFDVSGADPAPRAAPFVPVITTRVAAPYAVGGPFVDDVTITVDRGEWPRDENGDRLPLSASATVYRSATQPVPTEAPPADAVEVGRLSVVTDPEIEADLPYIVTSDWALDEPGFYTAVWTIRAADQPAGDALRLPRDYEWVEQFGVPSQVTMVPSIASRAEASVVAGRPVSDTVIVGAPLPSDGLEVSSALYRAVEGVAAAETCAPDHLVWTSAPERVSAAGEITVTAPAIDEPGTYYWQERATDRAGALVHLGVCGLAAETTRVTAPAAPPEPAPSPTPTPTPTPTPSAPASPEPTPAPTESPVPVAESAPERSAPPDDPGSLASTGIPRGALRLVVGLAIALLTVGTTLISARRRRRFEAHPRIG